MQLSTTYISGDHSKFVAPPSVDLRAVGEIVFTRPESVTDPLVSGTVVRGKVTERFDLIDGNVAVPSTYTQDLVLYQRPCLTNPGAGAVSAVSGTVATPELRAAFPVTPSKQYSIIELLMGKKQLRGQPRTMDK